MHYNCCLKTISLKIELNYKEHLNDYFEPKYLLLKQGYFLLMAIIFTLLFGDYKS